MRNDEELSYGGDPTTEDLMPDLAELCQIYEVGLDLIERSHDVDDLLDHVLDEYERRLEELPSEALDPRSRAHPPESVKKLKALMMFATQAAALKEKALAADELRRKSRMLEEANARLDGVLASIASGILVLGANGSVVRANAAARAILGDVEAPGLAARIRAVAPASGEGEFRLPEAGAGPNTTFVSRRPISDSSGSEVVLVMDVTQRNRDVEERVRLEKLAEVMRTLSVLSHKINNPLTALLGRAQILSSRKVDDPHVVKAAAVIAESSQRIADLIRELGTVVREGKQEALDVILKMPDGSFKEGE